MGAKSPEDHRRSTLDASQTLPIWLRQKTGPQGPGLAADGVLDLHVEIDIHLLAHWLCGQSHERHDALAGLESLHLRAEGAQEIVAAGWLSREKAGWPVSVGAAFQLDFSDDGHIDLVAIQSFHTGQAPLTCEVPALFAAELFISLLSPGICTRMGPDRWRFETDALVLGLLERCGYDIDGAPDEMALNIELERGSVGVQIRAKLAAEPVEATAAPAGFSYEVEEHGAADILEAADIAEAQAILDQALRQGRLPMALRFWERIRREHPGLILGKDGSQLLRRWAWLSEGAGLLQHALHRLRVVATRDEIRLESLAILARYYRKQGDATQAAYYLKQGWDELGERAPTALARWVFGWALMELLAEVRSPECPTIHQGLMQLHTFLTEEAPQRLLGPITWERAESGAEKAGQSTLEGAASDEKPMDGARVWEVDEPSPADERRARNLEEAFKEQYGMVARVNRLWARIDGALAGQQSTPLPGPQPSENAEVAPARLALMVVEKPPLEGRAFWQARREAALKSGKWKHLLDEIQGAIHLCDEKERRGLTKEMALIYVDMGVPSRAERHLRALLAEDAFDKECESMLKGLYLRLGEIPKILELRAFLIEARQSPEEASRQLRLLAQESAQQGFMAMERMCLLRACSLAPQALESFLQLEALLRASGEYEAISELWKLRESLPGESGYDAQFRVALAQLDGGDWSSARVRLERLVTIPKFRNRARALLAEALGVVGESLLTEADRHGAGAESVHEALARGEALLHNRKLPNWQRAESFFRLALRNEPLEPRAVRGLVQILSRRGQVDEAIGLLSSTIEGSEVPQERGRWLQELGDVYLVHLGDPEAARKYYAEAEILINTSVLH